MDKQYVPCPFCGGSSMTTGRQVVGHGEMLRTVVCLGCGATVPSDFGLPNAPRKWNRRVRVLNPGVLCEDLQGAGQLEGREIDRLEMTSESINDLMLYLSQRAHMVSEGEAEEVSFLGFRLCRGDSDKIVFTDGKEQSL